MAFAWNLETIEFVTEGEISDYGTPTPITVDSGCTLEIEPWSSSVMTSVALGESMWFGDALTATAIGSLPAIRTPVQRVCGSSSSPVGCLLNMTATGTGKTADVQFWIGTDPLNSGKFRIYYYFAFNFIDTVISTYEIRYSHASISGFAGWTSGNIAIAGISFNWYSAYSSSAAPLSGSGTLSATSGSFTY